MSNSAFTPTTTTVTNNVPTNVPVVTAWENYTPTISPISGYATSPHGQWRRVGDNMEVRISFKKNTSAGTGGTLLFGLPSGYNIDVTKCATEATDQPAFGIANGFNIITSNQYDRSLTVMYVNGNTTQVGVINPGTSAFINGSNVLANSEFNLEFRVPISQWASSGTTTLATRAVEEYAWNSDSSNAPNTSSFGNGPDGVLFPAITVTGTAVSKRVRFQTAIQSTDTIILEYQQQSTGPWRAVSQRIPLIVQGSGTYGLELRNVSGSNTDIDVNFRESGAISSGATYGAPGEVWNSYKIDNWKWRVRKVSSGAQVGYPVSARNIVGDTSGSVVPTGMLGETRVNSETGTVVPGSSGTWATIESITLSRGTWLVTGIGYYFTATGTLPTGFSQFRAGLSTGATTSPDEGFYGFIQNPINIADGGGSITVPPRVFTITSDSQQIFLVAYCLYSTVGTLLLNKNQSSIQAVRIA